MSPELPATVVEAAVSTARRWADEARHHPEPRAATLLGDALKDPGGLRFTLDFVDGVLRPEDTAVAAGNLAALARRPARFLPPPLRLGLRSVAPVARPALGVVRRAFTAVVGDLVVDFGRSLGPALARLRRGGADLNVNLLGEAVLGERHAASRLRRTMELVERDDVDYVSIKVSSVLGPHAPFAHRATVDEAVHRLRPLFSLAKEHDTFVNLDMEEYRDLHLTLDVFRALLSEPGLRGVRAGVAVQTYLRESLLLLGELDQFARGHVAAGGHPVKVRLVKGANLAMERVNAEVRGWDNPIWGSKEETDASYLRALDFCLTPERAAHLHTGAASHNVYTLAAAWEIAKARRVTDALDIEMLSGMATPLQRVLLSDVGRLRLYVPVVPRAEYDSAIAYLVRRLEENAAPENFMSGAVGLGHDAAFLDLEERRFRTALGHLDDPVPQRWAGQDRHAPGRGFTNAQDTNPALLENQRWAAELHDRLPAPSLGLSTLQHHTITEVAEVDALLERGRKAGMAWFRTPPSDRVAALHRLAVELESLRGDLITVAGDEVGKLIDQADVEVSEAVDFANYYASLAQESVPGTEHVPPRLTTVAPPWNFPIAIPLGGVATALAVGSAVVLKPAPPARRTAALLAEACWRAGLPEDLVQLAIVGDGLVSKLLITDPRVDLVVLTGAAETAELFRSWRPALPLLAETSGKNAIIVTPSADLDLAVADLANSAFGHAGQKCSAASLGILVGSVARSRRFRSQLLDAVRSLKVAWPTAPPAQMGPLTEPPGEKLLRGLTRLEPGQRWLLEPKRLDTRLWRPGIRAGVLPGSEYHQVEYFGPILGLMAAQDLDEAIAWQNGTDFGLTAGLHSLDPDEVARWVERVQAGNAYVNRSITGAVVRRQPFGGWKRSAVGAGGKAGGPNYLTGFGTHRAVAVDHRPTDTTVSTPPLARLLRGAETVHGVDIARLTAAVASDEEAARTVFGVPHDPSALAVEINVLRYLPTPVTVRVETADATSVLREASAALAAGAPARFSFATAPEETLVRVLSEAGFAYGTQAADDFDRAVRGRVRFLGARSLLTAVRGSIDVTAFDGDPMLPGRLALLPYVREQAVSITHHRFGHPTHVVDKVRF
ncbi:bifunctional proline dehydrogenase/L-glutamate gamma-semialdehyde dehydrogenase [Tessaracoccus sp. MC1865]|uniref:bifunctional proline dehydrogenase/L-glutamate gamma-semialdehyde dehydrogenase n=1 Tax=Tessaracoccus sp. MC1865 TaxID=2760310 RepID=UPI001601C73C|nr:bifunctional proline dehydrogenase/L-glutamate gamma-semialdehyde dehydrogenase [Tessaracoccus sp. MC1865]MBB1484840.1 bifunctional proline dehydrogenase/L-glutamate gamma-semialdehyde dehydrogenase [Tessaracoccus sp. MC1865]QTO38758.1 bifunctional proline dehydrogenase/L-glutamate gamma-semialdehyde dehydrogenase [Tessaracoccus sp. MC1865]